MKKYYIRDADNDMALEQWAEDEEAPESRRLDWCEMYLAWQEADSPEDAVEKWMDGQLRDGISFDEWPATVEVYDEDGDLEGTFEARERVEVIREITQVRGEQ